MQSQGRLILLYNSFLSVKTGYFDFFLGIILGGLFSSPLDTIWEIRIFSSLFFSSKQTDSEPNNSCFKFTSNVKLKNQSDSSKNLVGYDDSTHNDKDMSYTHCISVHCVSLSLSLLAFLTLEI